MYEVLRTDDGEGGEETSVRDKDRQIASKYFESLCFNLHTYPSMFNSLSNVSVSGVSANYV